MRMYAVHVVSKALVGPRDCRQPSSVLCIIISWNLFQSTSFKKKHFPLPERDENRGGHVNMYLALKCRLRIHVLFMRSHKNTRETF